MATGKLSGREVVLATFDRLFEKAAEKLRVQCTDVERAEAKQRFEERFRATLDVVQRVEFPELPEKVIREMEAAVEQLSPAEIVGLLASMPLAQQTHEMLRAIAFRAAEQRLLEHVVAQADTRYGGN
jgi:hypothetical protein